MSKNKVRVNRNHGKIAAKKKSSEIYEPKNFCITEAANHREENVPIN